MANYDNAGELERQIGAMVRTAVRRGVSVEEVHGATDAALSTLPETTTETPDGGEGEGE